MESIENKKNFKILKINDEEAHLLGWGTPKGCLCSFCNEIIKGDIYYIAVLNDVADKECCENWIEKATHYEEDMSLEDRLYNAAISNLEYYGHELLHSEEKYSSRT
jgi:hypothetical protein